MPADDWFLLGAPWDCSASHRGEEDAPDALRKAGLSRVASTDVGDAATGIRTRERDAETGVLALQDTVRAARALESALTTAINNLSERRPLVVGGDCSVLLGILPAVRRSTGPLGLWFVDGHPDYQDAHASDTGETADLELACITGGGPTPLVELADDPPMVKSRDIVLMGHRTQNIDPASLAEVERLPADLRQLDAASVRIDPHAAGTAASEHLQEAGIGAWLHIDLDVLDPAALPAVTYPQSGGLDWAELTALVMPLAHSPRLLGVSIADFRPDLDPDGSLATGIVRLLADVLP